MNQTAEDAEVLGEFLVIRNQWNSGDIGKLGIFFERGFFNQEIRSTELPALLKKDHGALMAGNVYVRAHGETHRVTTAQYLWLVSRIASGVPMTTRSHDLRPDFDVKVPEGNDVIDLSAMDIEAAKLLLNEYFLDSVAEVVGKVNLHLGWAGKNFRIYAQLSPRGDSAELRLRTLADAEAGTVPIEKIDGVTLLTTPSWIDELVHDDALQHSLRDTRLGFRNYRLELQIFEPVNVQGGD